MDGDTTRPDGAKDLEHLRGATEVIWNTNAAFWDERMADGNIFQRMLVGPTSERLLEIVPGERVLEIACGNGVMSRRLAALGASVLATDVAEEMLARAQARQSAGPGQIEYRRLDATDPTQLSALGARVFDAVLSNMALMDMPAVAPLFDAVPRLLKPNGRFVFSLMHPCFNHSGSILMSEEEDREGTLITTYSVKIPRYKSVGITHGLAIIGQPVPQYYFHRTLEELFGAAFRAGLVIDGLAEPAFPPGEPTVRPFGWGNYTEIPPVLVARLRVKGA